MLLVALVSFSCEREFSAPPLTEPMYEWPPANITIAEIKEQYASITDPTVISDSWILRAVVTSSDEAGNIYKSLYIQDETGAINIGIEQSYMYSNYAVGQEIYIDLEGLYVVKYGGELQIGYTGTNANRISWELFNEKTSINGWPDTSQVEKLVLTSLGNLTDDMVNNLVEIRGIHFANAGTRAFVSNGETTNEPIQDDNGNAIDVRTSNYATFGADMLPVGRGTLVGLLGRYNGGWQLLLRSRDDVRAFDGIPPGSGGEEQTDLVNVFYETFGTGSYPSGNRPTIAEFTDFDMKSPVVYTDESGAADIRSISGNNGAHIWLPSNRDVTIRITGINTAGYEDLQLSYQLAGNLYDAGTASNLNAVKVRVNGTDADVPNQVISNANGDNNVFHTVTINDAIPAVSNLTIEFVVSAADNTVGLRLDNIRITAPGGGSSGGEVIDLRPD